MIFIRADANEQIGTGHVMRCLSVADALLSAGEDVAFVTADHIGDRLIKNKGYNTICLNSEWTRLDEETAAFIDLIKTEAPKLTLVDSYYVTENYFEKLSPHTKTVYFDDMNSHNWDVDYLINYNVFADALDYSWYEGTRARLLLGPKYAPLRNEFANMSPHKIRDVVSDIMVSAGGADPEGVTELIMDQVCSNRDDITFHFIVGALNPRIEGIRKRERCNITLHINEQNMSGLMMKCDIAIAAAGTTLYELCASGIPTITYTLADNQLVAAEQFGKRGIMLNAGDCRSNSGFMTSLQRCLDDLILDWERRETMSNKMTTLVDGNGAMNIVKVLMEDAGNNAN